MNLATKTIYFVYNAAGLRVRRIDQNTAVTKLYSYQGNSIASIQESSGGSFGGKDWVYTVAPGMISNALERHQPNYTGNSTQSQYYQYDHRGNAAIVTDSSGKVKYGYQYDAFGNLRSTFELGQSSGPTDDILFTGKDWDPDLDLYYFNARWYDPEIGRFLSRAGFPPQKEHPYGYCEANPVLSADPAGRYFDVSGGTRLKNAMMENTIDWIYENSDMISDDGLRKAFICRYESQEWYPVYLRYYFGWVGWDGFATPMTDEIFINAYLAPNRPDSARSFLHELAHNIYGPHGWWHDLPYSQGITNDNQLYRDVGDRFFLPR